ncbi:MAG: ankyrin repeat domain-containing protein [Gammaproteobacteria bacterium]|nr:ankyrin repeat domain-containing protein [Gammaproteobacteria bacterium]
MIKPKELLFELIQRNNEGELNDFLNKCKKLQLERPSTSSLLQIFRQDSFTQLMKAKNGVGDSPLYYAIKHSADKSIQSLIAAGINVNDQFYHKELRTDAVPFYYACTLGNSEIIKQLINTGADVNIPLILTGPVKQFPLSGAAFYGHSETVAILIDHNADVNADDNMGYRPVHYALNKGHYQIVSQLMAAGADINAKTMSNTYAIDIALIINHKKCIELLIDAGAVIYYDIAKLPNTNIDWSHKVVIGLTINRQQITRRTPGFENAITTIDELMNAIQSGRVFNIKALAARCDHLLTLDKNHPVRPLRDALQANFRENYIESVSNPHHGSPTSKTQEDIIDNDTKESVSSRHNDTATSKTQEEPFNSIINNDANKLEIFLTQYQQSHSNVNITSRLRSIFVGGSLKQLMQVKNSDGNSPLFIAINGKSEQIIQLLINAGANVNEEIINKGDPNRSETLLNIAISNKSSGIVAHLIAAGAYVNRPSTMESGGSSKCRSPLQTAASIGSPEIVAQLILVGANVNAATTDGMTALHYAAENGNHQIISQLIAAKANMTAAGQNLETPIDIATKKGYVPCVELLLDAGGGLYRNFTNLPSDPVNWTHKVLIGSTINFKPITRKMAGFEKAITTPYEFLNAIKGGAPFNRNALLVSCNRLLQENDNNSSLKELRNYLWAIALPSDIAQNNSNNAEESSSLLARWEIQQSLPEQMNKLHLCKDVNEKNSRIQKLLPVLIKNNLEGVFDKEIIELGNQYPDAVNEFGESLLHLLITSCTSPNRWRLIDNLIHTHHINPNSVDNAGQTPLQYLMNNLWDGNIIDIMKFIRLGANPQSLNNEGKTVLELFEKYNSKDSLHAISELRTLIDKEQTKKLSIQRNRTNKPAPLDSNNSSREDKIQFEDLDVISPSMRILFRAAQNNNVKLLTAANPGFKITFALAVLYVYWHGKINDRNIMYKLFQGALFCLGSDTLLLNYESTSDIVRLLQSSFQNITNAASLGSENPAILPPTDAIPFEFYHVDHPLAMTDHIFDKRLDTDNERTLTEKQVTEPYSSSTEGFTTENPSISQYKNLSFLNNQNESDSHHHTEDTLMQINLPK